MFDCVPSTNFKRTLAGEIFGKILFFFFFFEVILAKLKEQYLYLTLFDCNNKAKIYNSCIRFNVCQLKCRLDRFRGQPGGVTPQIFMNYACSKQFRKIKWYFFMPKDGLRFHRKMDV